MESQVTCSDCTRFRPDPERPESSIGKCGALRKLPEVLVYFKRICQYRKEAAALPKQARRN